MTSPPLSGVERRIRFARRHTHTNHSQHRLAAQQSPACTAPPARADCPRSSMTAASAAHPAAPPLRFIDLFCGIGGFRIAFERIGARCVFSSDWDRHSQTTYAANFGELPHGDIHTVAVADIPAHDILCGGFPCQPFSLAGVSKKKSLGRKHGFEDEKQGNLFFSIAEILDYHKPAAFVLENVKNLKSHDKGQTFRIIYDTLTRALGYQVHYKVIDARHVVPQHRERVFLVGFREPRYFEFAQSDAQAYRPSGNPTDPSRN